MPHRAALEDVLRLAYGTEAAAERTLDEALQAAGTAELPATVEELRVFAHAHVLPLLERDHGPTLAVAMMAEVEVALAELRVRDPDGHGET